MTASLGVDMVAPGLFWRGNMRRRLLSAVAGAALAWGAQAQAQDCKLSVIGDLPVESLQGAPLIEGKVNGHPTRFLADTGADITVMWREAATDLGVKLGNSPNMEIYGVGGRAPVQLAYIDTLAIGSAVVRNFRVYVVASHDLQPGVSMLLGNQFFNQTDVAFDLPEKKILLLKEAGCSGPQLIFWNKPYSQTPYRGGDAERGAIYVTVMLNGQPVEAEIDSGASATVVDENLAARLGAVTVGDPSPYGAGGVGFKKLPHHSVRFKTFSIGDETIQNASIQAAPLFSNVKLDATGTRLGSEQFNNDMPRMLLGSDFLRAHQLLISRPHQMLYFSYLGGPVFDIYSAANRGREAAAGSPSGSPAPSKP